MSLNSNSVIFETNLNFIEHETVILNEPQPSNELNENRKRKKVNEENEHCKKSKYQLREGCTSKCRKQCSTVISQDARANINSYFWSLSFSERRLWLDSHILINPVKTRTTNDTEHSRSNSIQYSLSVASTKMAVCKSMF